MRSQQKFQIDKTKMNNTQDYILKLLISKQSPEVFLLYPEEVVLFHIGEPLLGLEFAKTEIDIDEVVSVDFPITVEFYEDKTDEANCHDIYDRKGIV